jgi:hypothetical protein
VTVSTDLGLKPDSVQADARCFHDLMEGPGPGVKLHAKIVWWGEKQVSIVCGAKQNFRIVFLSISRMVQTCAAICRV